MKTQTMGRWLALGVMLCMGHTAWAQGFTAGDEIPLDVLMEFTVPGVSYISQAGIDYYHLDVQEVQGDNLLITDPISAYANLKIEVRGIQGESPGPNPPPMKIEALVYTEDSQEVYQLISSQSGSPYLNGKVYFFTYVYNPDMGKSPYPVHRIAVLGLTAGDEFGFFRVIDTFGQLYPSVSNSMEDFQIWSSPASYAHGGSSEHSPYYFEELVVEAGSPSALGGKK